MTKFVAVDVTVTARVLVELPENEGLEEALNYAHTEFCHVDGDVIASNAILVSGSQLENEKRHADAVYNL